MKEAAITHSPHAFVPKKELTEEERRERYRTRIDESIRPYTVIDVLTRVYHRSFEDDLLEYIGKHPEPFQIASEKWKLSRAWVNSLRIIRPESVFFQEIKDFQVDIAVEAGIRIEEVRQSGGLLKRRRALRQTLPDGKMRLTDCADTEQLLRIIQSIPSPKAEPFKRWLAAIGAERIREIADPEIAAQRAQDLYRKKGYPDEWIALRARGIATRAELTDEWKKRGVESQSDYAILTADISRATFGMTPSEYKRLKGLKIENLRDHMTTLELLFTELGEAATTEIARNIDAQGMNENRDAAHRGGKIAGDARRNLEEQTGRRVSTSENYKGLTEKKKKRLE